MKVGGRVPMKVYANVPQQRCLRLKCKFQTLNIIIKHEPIVSSKYIISCTGKSLKRIA